MIWLIGMMGSGKSTLGALLAEVLDAPWWDSDREVEASTGMTVRQLWEARGEAALRAAESEVVQGLANRGRGIVATGGGVVLDPANVEAMQRSGTVIWLQAEPPALARRISGNARPLLDTDDVEGRLAEILEGRRDLYAAAANAAIDTETLSPAEIVAEIGRHLP